MNRTPEFLFGSFSFSKEKEWKKNNLQILSRSELGVDPHRHDQIVVGIPLHRPHHGGADVGDEIHVNVLVGDAFEDVHAEPGVESNVDILADDDALHLLIDLSSKGVGGDGQFPIFKGHDNIVVAFPCHQLGTVDALHQLLAI